MKNILLLAASFGIISSLAAQSPANPYSDDPGKSKSAVDTPHFQNPPAQNGEFCASTEGGKIAVLNHGKAILENVTLSNGTVIFKDGTLVTIKGERRLLKNGECVDKNGNPL